MRRRGGVAIGDVERSLSLAASPPLLGCLALALQVCIDLVDPRPPVLPSEKVGLGVRVLGGSSHTEPEEAL